MKNKHGGKRRNAGRKRLYDGPTTKIVCPKSIVSQVKGMIQEMHQRHQLDVHPHYVGTAAGAPPALRRPLAHSHVPAGFPSPADDYVESELDLNNFFVRHPSATFYWRVSGDSMNLAGILDGCYLLIDRSLEPVHNDVVLATVNGDVTVKRFVRTGNYFELRPESTNQDYKPLRYTDESTMEIWGVVGAAFNKFR